MTTDTLCVRQLEELDAIPGLDNGDWGEALQALGLSDREEALLFAVCDYESFLQQASDDRIGIKNAYLSAMVSHVLAGRILAEADRAPDFIPED